MTGLVARSCGSCGAALGAGSLTCAFCGTSHAVAGDGGGLLVACGACGAPSLPGARACTQCAAALQFTCPECRARTPIGSRFCQECRIELATYRRARVQRAVSRVASRDDAAARAREWLDGRWFKARDLQARLDVGEVLLEWLPMWELRARVTGRVQGQVSQTHYRTTSEPELDPATGRWVDRVRSVPYTVWEHVAKDFDEQVSLAEPATRRRAGVYTFLGAPAGVELEALRDGEAVGRDGARAHPPDDPDVEAFARLRGQAEARLHATLLDRVETLEARFLGPRLDLVYYPVWEVRYAYRRKHGHVRLSGADLRAEGDRITLLSQWFG